MSLDKYIGKDPADLPSDVLAEILAADAKGEFFGGMSSQVRYERERALDSPSFLATEIVDPFYKQHFERIHCEAMDEVFAPYILGESLKLEGSEYDPSNYIGLLVLFSRDTFKSSMMWLILLWTYLHTKLRLGWDTRAMYVHQVLEKAIERGENIRNTARLNRRFRTRFPEFRAQKGEWDKQQAWRWPTFQSHGAGEKSWTAYGETSGKTGGHYTIRIVDDWVTEESVGTPDQLTKSWSRFQAMDPLRDRSNTNNPYLIAGTNYHYQDTYQHMETDGGYLVWRVPAHTGSTKAIFDLVGLDPKTEDGRKRIEVGLRRLEQDRAGDLNFPKRLSWRELYKSARGQGPHHFACQMLLNPVPEGEQRFNRAILEQSWVDRIPVAGDLWLYIRCDPAISEKKKADETAILVIGVDWKGHRYFLDGWIGREKRATVIVRRMFEFGRKWMDRGYMVRNIGVEAVQYQEALAQMCRDGVPEYEAGKHGESVPILKSPCPVRSIKRSADMRKGERILEMDGPISRREVWFWRENPVAGKLMTQFVNFPFDRDDGLDAAHDGWEAVLCPPPVKEVKREMPAWLKKIVRPRSETGVPTGMSGTVDLHSWK